MHAEVVNAYWSRGALTLVERAAGGGVRSRRVPAEHSCFVRDADVPPDRWDRLRRSPRVVNVVAEGEYRRVLFEERDACRDFCQLLARGGVQTFEGVISPVVRYMADVAPRVARPRICYLDLETDPRVPFSRKEEARTLMWAVVGDDGRELQHTLVADDDDSERALYAALWEALGDYDLVAAWNGDRFDFEVLLARSGRHRLLGAALDPRRWLWLDHMELFRRMNMSAAESGDEKQSVALSAVAESVVGEGKVPFDARRIWEYWAAGGAKLRELQAYNLHDARLMPKIEQKTGYVELLIATAQTCGTFPDSRGVNPSVQVEGFLQRLAVERGYHFPTRLDADDSGEQFAGAFVLPPSCSGIQRDVHVCDFARLYPSVAISLNMSLETLRGKADSFEERPPGTSWSPLTKVCFDTSEQGILPAAFDALLKLRKQWADKAKKLPPGTPERLEAERRSAAYKIVGNSFYGVIGQARSRFFERMVAESIAQGGVWLIKRTIEEAEARGMRCIYGDSVTGDRIVVARDPAGDVRLLPIAELFGEAPGAMVRGKEHKAIPGWKALARDPKTGAEGWCDIKSVIRHRANKATWRITTKHGQTQVTEDHGIMVGADQVRPADFVGGRMRFDVVDAPAEEPADVVDLYRYVAGFEYAFEYKGRRVSRTFEVHQGDWLVLGGWGGSYRLKVPRYYRRGSAEHTALLRLVAAYCSDGSASVRGRTAGRHMLSFCKAELPLMMQLAEDLRRLCPGLEVFGPYWSDTVYVVRSGTALMACLFAALCGSGTREKRFPPFFFQLDYPGFELVHEMLGRGDGHVDAAGQTAFTTTSARLAAGVSYLWSQHGVEHAFSYRESKGAWAIRTRATGSERPSRYSIKAEVFDPDPGQYVYDLEVDGAHTFVDGVGRVLLHNTDSLFVVGAPQSEFEAFVAWCNSDLYPEMLRSVAARELRVELDYDKAFDRLVIVTKKRYCASFLHSKGAKATAESKPEIKGLEYKRGDSVRLARRMQEEVVHLLVGYKRAASDSPGDFADLLDRWLGRVLDGRLSLDDVLVSKRLSKPLEEYARKPLKDGSGFARQLPHIELARELADRGLDMGEGAKVDYVVVGPGEKPQRVVAAADWDGELDRAGLWESYVYPPTQRLLEAAFPGWSWGDWLDVGRLVERRGVVGGAFPDPGP